MIVIDGDKYDAGRSCDDSSSREYSCEESTVYNRTVDTKWYK